MSAGSLRILVVGIGNPDRGDDGIGPRIAEMLRDRVPSGVSVKSRSGDALALLQDWAAFDAVILVDAAAPAGAPGRIHRVDLAVEPLPRDLGLASTHAFGIAEAIALAAQLKRLPPRLVIYAIEAAAFTAGADLSPAVEAAGEGVASRILAEVAGWRGGIDSDAELFQNAGG